ncbi:hypothetical protein QQF64_028690 [Cirrhinus molitorella]|uniref:Uncharacterized protein n=1 Tax=Cirrhinus molitorella TaxID=172907 RepID=A0ABR3N7P9_9TELE
MLPAVTRGCYAVRRRRCRRRVRGQWSAQGLVPQRKDPLVLLRFHLLHENRCHDSEERRAGSDTLLLNYPNKTRRAAGRERRGKQTGGGGASSSVELITQFTREKLKSF